MATEITLFVLLMVASAVAMLAKRLSLPYTVTLVVAGLFLGMLPPHFAWLDLDRVRLTPELLFNIFLPMLLFEAAFHLSWPKFRENLTAILLLAVPGVVVAVGLGGTFAYWLEPLANTTLPIIVALLFASMLAATDPVSVVALFKELGVPKRLAVVMEGESLLNDAVGVVVFIVVSAMLGLGHTDEAVTPLWVARILVWEILVGIGIGAAVGLSVSWMTTLVDDHLVEIMLTTIAAFGSYLLATACHASAILAVVAAGMACGNVGARYGMTPTNRIAVESFWEYAVFVANGFVFLLLGKEIDVFRMLGHGAEIVIAWVALMVARGVVVFVVERLLLRTREKLPPRWSSVLLWGGLRGSLSMVLALSLPLDFQYRELLVDLTFGVVLLSILVQGTTMTPLLRWSGAVGGGNSHVEYLRLRTALRAARAALKHLDEQLAGGDIHEQTYETLRSRLGGREAALEEQLSRLDDTLVDAQAAEMARVEEELLEVERHAIREASEAGLVPREALEALLSDLVERSQSARGGHHDEAAPGVDEAGHEDSGEAPGGSDGAGTDAAANHGPVGADSGAETDEDAPHPDA